MPDYDTSLIVEFLTGTGDGVITMGTTSLQQKVGGQSITISGVGTNPLARLPAQLAQQLTAGLGGLTANSRLYLRGHGDWQHQTMGGWTAKNMAALLKKHGLQQCKLISVSGCNAGRFAEQTRAELPSFGAPFVQRKAAYENLLARSTHSFAGLLHFYLGKSYGIYADLVARTYYVTVGGDGSKVTSPGNSDEWHKQRYTKLRFTWQNGEQQRDWITYA